jgi:anthranilate phosphoribosyltransferase
LNAAAALVVAGLASDLAEGVALAQEVIDHGRAAAVLDQLRKESQVAAEG